MCMYVILDSVLHTRTFKKNPEKENKNVRNLILCFGEQEERLKMVKEKNVNVYVYACIPECMCIHAICMQEPAEAKREHQILCSWSYRWSLATVWLLGNETGSYGCALN